MKFNSKADNIFLAVIILVHAVFFLMALKFTRIFMGDSYEYIYMALNIKDHFLFYSGNAAIPLLAKYYTLRPPAYSLFLLVVYFFTVNNWLVLVLQNIVSVANILLLRSSLLRLGHNKRHDWLLLLFIVAFPAQFIYADTIAPDLLLQTFVVIYFHQGLLLFSHKKAKHALLMSIVLTLGVFTKPVLYPFILVHIILLFWLGYRYRSAKNYLLTLAIPILSVFLYNTCNAERTGKFHFSSIQPINAMFYNVKLFKEHQLGQEKAKVYIAQERAKMQSMPTFKDWYEYGDKRSLQVLKDNFVPYMLFHIRYTLLFFIHPGKGEIDLFTGALTYGRLYGHTDKRIGEILKETPVQRLPSLFIKYPSVIGMFVVLFFNCIKIVGLIRFAFLNTIRIELRFFTFLLLGYFAFMTGPVVNTRYVLPVSLIITCAAVLGIQSIINRRRPAYT